MRRSLTFSLPPVLALVGLSACCLLLWRQTARFRESVEKIAENVRVSLIDLDGKVVYDSTGQELPSHAARAEFEAVKSDGRARSVVRESETLHIAMFYHARRVGNFVLRIAVPYQSVTDAKAYAVRGLLAAIGIGALVVLVLIFFMRRYEERLSRLALERDLQDKLLAEMRKLEAFRRDFISNVTHEIKTSVTGILGAVDVLADGGHGCGFLRRKVGDRHRRSWRWHAERLPGEAVRAVLSRRQGQKPCARRDGAWPCHRQAHRPAPRRRSVRRVDAWRWRSVQTGILTARLPTLRCGFGKIRSGER